MVLVHEWAPPLFPLAGQKADKSVPPLEGHWLAVPADLAIDTIPFTYRSICIASGSNSTLESDYILFDSGPLI